MNYLYSFSGADARAFAYFDGVESEIARLESIHTISVSVHEAKGQVRSLGYRGIRGITRAVRTIGGSIIFQVIQDHPLRALIASSYKSPMVNRLGWSVDRDVVGVGTALNMFDYGNKLPTLLPPFNILMTFTSELSDAKPLFSPVPEEGGVILGIRAPGASMLIRGIELIDDGHVTSVNDIVTEITFSYIARDFKPISLNSFGVDTPPPPKPAVLDTSGSEHDWERQKQIYDRIRPPDPSPVPIKTFDETGEELSPELDVGFA